MKGLRQTPEKIKQSMISRVTELKQHRESARHKEVDEKMDKRFKDPGSERAGIAMTGRTWPHGFTGKAIPHGTVFSR